MFEKLNEEGDQDQAFKAYSAYEEAKEKVKAASARLGILDDYHRRLSADEVSDLEAIRTAPSDFE